MDRLEWIRVTPSRARLLSGGRVQRRLRQPNVVHTNGPVGMESRKPVVGPTPKWWKRITAFEAAQRRSHLWTGWNEVEEPRRGPDS
ncbi:hypothetical protein JTE90_013801 [Oedothorax gibbosus]|uniref:Uncharacterized protein n=1 Tax=Oedothorax gibbosus TaxID=931172 RepID=A0AAV6VL95_9ARAC|nr:hypothetical protein JTE90_013801 [Oedothorax gibbosus]